MTDLEAAVWAVEVKRVSYRGVRMSSAQRRAVAGADKRWKNRPDSIYSLGSGREVYSAGSMAGEPGVALRGTFKSPAKRATGQAARKKRLAAAGIGPAKPSKRLKGVEKARRDLMGARAQARAFIAANR